MKIDYLDKENADHIKHINHTSKYTNHLYLTILNDMSKFYWWNRIVRHFLGQRIFIPKTIRWCAEKSCQMSPFLQIVENAYKQLSVF